MEKTITLSPIECVSIIESTVDMDPVLFNKIKTIADEYNNINWIKSQIDNCNNFIKEFSGNDSFHYEVYSAGISKSTLQSVLKKLFNQEYGDIQNEN